MPLFEVRDAQSKELITLLNCVSKEIALLRVGLSMSLVKGESNFYLELSNSNPICFLVENSTINSNGATQTITHPVSRMGGERSVCY
jgi:hypothetical protein